MAYSFFLDGDILSGSINGAVAMFFFGLLIRNILKTKKEKEIEKVRLSNYRFD